MSDTLIEQKTSPMMMQWQACKKKAGDALLLFRMGDFYEAFYEDATIIARELGLTLTKRMDIPMCGIPHFTSDGHVDKLVCKGYRIAVAEQMEDPKQVKGIVKREVVRIITSGTLINSSLLSDKANNYIAALSRVGQIFGFAILDLTTAEFKTIELKNEQELLNEIYRLQPVELVFSKKFQEKQSSMFEDLRKNSSATMSTHDDWHFEHQSAHDFLTAHFQVKSLEGYGLGGMVAAINAAGGLLSYLQEVLCLSIAHIQEITPYSTSQYMTIDKATRRHLELTESLNESSNKNTLLGILDKTWTPMGGRLLRQWIRQPLLDPSEIGLRQDSIQAFLQNYTLLDGLSRHFDEVRDIERLIMKISSGYATPRDLWALKCSFEPMQTIKNILSHIGQNASLLAKEAESIDPLPDLIQLISSALVEDPPIKLTDGNIFRAGYNFELDELREIGRNGKDWLTRYQLELRESTGIKTLKINFNKMFGYYIEVSKGQAANMPESFQRRQTLVNAERYITPELKEYENKVLNAEERITGIEQELFTDLRQKVSAYNLSVQQTAQSIAICDTLCSLSLAARQHRYVRPVVDNSNMLQISQGRHPVIEALNMGEQFIPNDLYLDDEAHKLALITGPNMAGKSTYIRQAALLVIMAQIGSFLPASQAHIGIIDKVFSRIGASDDLSRGQSTFMVEMTETANILNNATSRSLVVLDEIGRGTSTYDGISIAWAVAEYLLTTEDRMAKTLFATHYWELTKLEEKVPGAVNYHVAVHEGEDKIIFLRKIVRGSTDKSYGIHVGRLAGLPSTVISRAKEILVHLEENANRKSTFEPAPTTRPPTKAKNKIVPDSIQLTFFG